MTIDVRKLFVHLLFNEGYFYPLDLSSVYNVCRLSVMMNATYLKLIKYRTIYNVVDNLTPT